MNAPLLAADRVSVRFNAVPALTEVSFSVAAGELLALIGPNGAGKTTLLNVLAGEIAPSAGGVSFDGRALTGFRPDTVARRGLARTFQAAQPFGGLTVRENVMVGAVPGAGIGLVSCLLGRGRGALVSGPMRRTADEHLAAVGLVDKADAPASVLTAGQRRLLGIAQVLATGARMLVLDEPGAGLNDSEKAFLGRVILSLSEAGKTIIFVDHDMPLVARIARRILVLDRGRLIADGEPEAVRADPQVVEAYLGRPKAAPLRSVAPPARSRKKLLEIEGLSLAYGGLLALDRVSLDVAEGEVVALVGANGAGKSSLLHAIARVEKGRADQLRFDGIDLAGVETDGAVALGISLVPEGRGLFNSLTVAENLASGRYAQRRRRGFGHVLWQSAEERKAHQEQLEVVYGLFPILKDRADQLAGTLSGGQGQMLAIGRALMGGPRLLLLDEPSLGLAPQVVDEILSCVERLRRQGLTILLVEQNVAAALSVADRGVVLANGRMVAGGSGRELLEDRRITEAYLGPAGASPARSDVPRLGVAV